MKHENKGLPIRDNAETITYHRHPTEWEIKFGHGAMHHACFDLIVCCHKGTRIPKKWFISQYDGLRYYKG